tara:strand:- start:583 stop:1017 length:435 start_codon:yes stop_codon:yes gene_type:complete
MMKHIIIFLFIGSILMGQDSLFWFDMNTVRDPMPKTPKIIDQIFKTNQLKILDSLKNARIISQDGFRLQIFETEKVEEANLVLNEYKTALNDSVYMIFEAPLYKIRLGDFVTRREAELEKNNLESKGYSGIWLVRSRISVSESP